MNIFTKTVGGVESSDTTAYLALLNWFCDRVEAGREFDRRDDPIFCGRTQSEFVVMLTAMIERDGRAGPDIDTALPIESQFLAVLEHLRACGVFSVLVVD